MVYNSLKGKMGNELHALAIKTKESKMDQQTNDLIKTKLKSNEVCLFMKGTPDAPQCGFSMATFKYFKSS